jgi:hypothetical protein
LAQDPATAPAWAENRRLSENAAKWWQQAQDKPGDAPFGPYRVIDVLLVAEGTNDAALQELAKGLLSRFAAREDWVSSAHKPRAIDLLAAAQARAVGVGYDALWSDLTPGERIWIRNSLLALLPYVDTLDCGRFPTGEYGNNWCSVVTGGIGVGAISLLGEDPRSAVWIHRLVGELYAVLDHAPTDGGWPEGLSYWEYAVESLAFFSAAIRRATDGTSCSTTGCHPGIGWTSAMREAAPAIAGSCVWPQRRQGAPTGAG